MDRQIDRQIDFYRQIDRQIDRQSSFYDDVLFTKIVKTAKTLFRKTNFAENASSQMFDWVLNTPSVLKCIQIDLVN